MFRNTLLTLIAMALAAVGYTTLRAQDPKSAPETPPRESRPNAPQAVPPNPQGAQASPSNGQYTIVPHDQKLILLDKLSGKTWILVSEANQPPVGVAIQRVDEEQALGAWKRKLARERLKADPDWDGMIWNVRILLEEAKSKFGPNHPKVVQLEKQIQEMKSSFEKGASPK